ncbi:uncharacterized protein LOC134818558 isoform X2 [Bolinopsis microptera]|uniref:uncharacterized protein LOC134818558 isoform X2 n=1 Tax=Bolinopsis microptera TaxID=2820187 RepID=UPI003078F2C9
MTGHLRTAVRAAKRAVSHLNYPFCTQERSGVITALVDCGCRWSRGELMTISERSKELDIDPVKIINVYDRNYDPTQFNISRKEAMLNFYVIDQKGNRHKNLDAMLFLYWHADRKVYCLAYPFYRPLNYIFEKLWLPHRFKFYGRDDVYMEITEDKKYMEWARGNRKKLNDKG